MEEFGKGTMEVYMRMIYILTWTKVE